MNKLLKGLLYLSALAFAAQSYANVIITGTRIIYSADDREATVRMENQSTTPALLQVWFDSGDANSTPETGQAPFIVMPPIFRIEPNKGQSVRIIYTHDPLPTDQESVFWFNALDIPPKPVAQDGEDESYLQFAIRSRLKIFYRPKNLPGSASEAAEKVQWELHQTKDGVVLHAVNSQAYFVSISSISFALADKTYTPSPAMLTPKSSQDFPVPDMKTLPTSPVELHYNTVNDYGAKIEHQVVLPMQLTGALTHLNNLH